MESDNTEVVSYWIPRIPIFCRMISFTKNVSYKLLFCPVLFLRKIHSWNTQQMKKTFFFVCLHYVMIDTGVKQIENEIPYNLNKLNYYRCYKVEHCCVFTVYKFQFPLQPSSRILSSIKQTSNDNLFRINAIWFWTPELDGNLFHFCLAIYDAFSYRLSNGHLWISICIAYIASDSETTIDQHIALS